MDIVDMASRVVAGVAFPAFVATYLMVRMEKTLGRLTAAIAEMTSHCRDCRKGL